MSYIQMSHYARALESTALGDPAELAAERTSQANHGAGLLQMYREQAEQTEQTEQTEQAEQTEQTEPLSRVGYRAMGAPALGDPAELAAERTSQANYGAGLSPVVAEEEI